MKLICCVNYISSPAIPLRMRIAIQCLKVDIFAVIILLSWITLEQNTYQAITNSPDGKYPREHDRTNITSNRSLVGSIGFAAIMTRPDIAFAHQILFQWLTKPERSHVIAAEQTISYLYGTRYHSIEFDGSCDPKYVFRAASDASFADNIGRKSSQGFIFTLFGGLIDWSARKQRIVTTSTTEAELVALSEAAKHLL